jgi:hypothetical protein
MTAAVLLDSRFFTGSDDVLPSVAGVEFGKRC